MKTLRTTTSAGHATSGWQDLARPVAERVELLLAEMTLEEKVGQLGSRWVGNEMPTTSGASDSTEDTAAPDDETLNVAPMQDAFAAGSPPLEEASRHGLGHLTRIYGSAPVSAVAGAAELVPQQRIVMESSRLGIPALVHEECLTGFTAYGATVYPAAIAWAATFDEDLVERMASAIGRDMAALGVHQGLSPVLDVVRNYRWGRVEETMGEDPYRDLERIVEPGEIEILGGTSAADLPCRGLVRLTGPVRVLGHDRHLVTPVSSPPAAHDRG